MKTLENYYDQYKDPKGCRITFWVLVTLGIMVILSLLFCPKAKAQRWADTNVGLYPNSIQGIVNAKNHAVGLKFDYLFEKPLLNSIPVGVYGSFSRTIKPNLRINNYKWENKYSIGLNITLPENGLNEMHSIISVALVYNQHPREWQNEGLLPGQYYAGYESTLPVGLDLGWRAQLHKWTAGFQIDVMNFFQYGQISFGRCFSFHK